MLKLWHRPELVTPELLAWLEPHAAPLRLLYGNAAGRATKWLVHEAYPQKVLPPELEGIARAVCPGLPPEAWQRVALQGYEDGRAVTPCHRDAGQGATFILSIGATRTFRIHRTVPVAGKEQDCETCGDPGLDVIEIECANGAVVWSGPSFCIGWHHQIPLEPEAKGERLSLVFRTMQMV